jgi:hypothetical protein
MDYETGRPNHIEDVLIKLHTGQWFGWSDSKNKVYANLIIHGDQEKPTQEFLESELARLQSEYDAQDYARNRQAEYPSTNDLIVALWENVIEERAASVIELEAKRQDVKTKYPKS